MDTAKMFLSNIPLPPSVNALYAGKARRYKSDTYKDWDKQFHLWARANSENIMRIKTELKHQIDTGYKALQINATFYFNKHQILTKGNQPKANDTSNRIKALHDALSDLLDIDDKYFWDGKFEKRVCADTYEPFCYVEIEPLNFSELSAI